MDYTALLRTIELKGSRLTGDDSTRVIDVLDDPDEDWKGAGFDEIESHEANNIATATFRTPHGLVVTARKFTFTPEQLRSAEELIEKYKGYGIDMSRGMPTEAIVGKGDNVVTYAVYGGYEDEETAVQDSRRLLLRTVIESEELSQAAGWRSEVVILARGLDFTVFRTHSDGRVDIKIAEHVLDAYAAYAKAVEELATRLKFRPEPDLVPPGTHDLIQTWLRRESAHALAEQARTNLMGTLRAFKQQPPISIAELARGLYTDRANLSRLMSKATN